MNMKQEIIGFVALALLIPFIIVSTWFGVSAVNHHFKSAEQAAEQADREERAAAEREFWKCTNWSMKPGDKTSTPYCITPKANR